MMKLDLQLFGGSGSGSGGGSGGGSKGGGAENKKSIKLGEYVTSPNGLKKDQEYLVIGVTEERNLLLSGDVLLTRIKDDKLKYDRSSGLWVSSNNKRYNIRRRKK